MTESWRVRHIHSANASGPSGLPRAIAGDISFGSSTQPWQGESEIRDCLESPSLVRESVKEPDVHLYYAPAEHLHLCVATAPADEDERFVVTAYFTKNIKPGKELWKS